MRGDKKREKKDTDTNGRRKSKREKKLKKKTGKVKTRGDRGPTWDGEEGGTCRRRLRAMDEGSAKVQMEVGPEGACNLAGGSNISLEQCHRHKHTHRQPWRTVVFERWLVQGEYSVATGTNTHRPREESDNTVYSKSY